RACRDSRTALLSELLTDFAGSGTASAPCRDFPIRGWEIMKLRNPIACVSAVLAVCASSGRAVAQDTTTAEGQGTAGVEAEVVTGVRASVQSALDEKKNADQLVDSIVAEDIGKLPDNNVIEALQHVTGVQISRNASEANQLLIRGLPDIATLLNGREIFTSA